MIGVISFPGTNCESETQKALNDVGLDAEIFLWNESVEKLENLDGYIIAGGFSFEDRGRSGVIASAYPIIDILRKASVEGKPILGICNGAQILVESGLLTDSIGPRIALSENKRIDKDGHLLGIGFYNIWTFLKTNSDAKTAFNDFDKIMQIPLAHAEGRFLISSLDDVKLVFQYSDKDGNVDDFFPINPNGSDLNAAGVSNLRGNVMAIMPHPERIEDGYDIFRSMGEFIKKGNYIGLKDGKFKLGKSISIKEKESFDIEIYIKLTITDNEAVSIKNAIGNKIGISDFEFGKFRFYGINNLDEDDFILLEELIFNGELSNFEKETFFLKKGSVTYKYLKGNKKEIVDNFNFSGIRVRNFDDVDCLAIKDLFGRFGFSAYLVTGKHWLIHDKIVLEKTLKTNVLANGVSQFIEVG